MLKHSLLTNNHHLFGGQMHSTRTLLSISSPKSLKSFSSYRPLLGKSENATKTLRVYSRGSHASLSTTSFSPDGVSSSSTYSEDQSGRMYAPYSIFKGKALMRVEPVPPKFTKLDSGAIRRSKEGSIMLVFAPAIGARQYDMERKQRFALSVSEIGQLLAMGPQDGCEFFHDPNMQKSDAGKVRKVLKVTSMQGKGGGYSFALTVSDKISSIEENVFVPVEKGEFAVMRSSFNFILPYLMGWNVVMDSIRISDSDSLPKSQLSEWDV